MNEERSRTSSKTVAQPSKMPWVIPVFCDGCAGCVNRCNRGLAMTRTNVDGVFVPWLAAPERCTGCGRCAQACAMGAISMTAYVDDALRRFHEKAPFIDTGAE